MSTAAFAPTLSFDSTHLSFRPPPIFWALLASILAHGVALGWLPGLHQVHEMVSNPLRVLLRAPAMEPVAVPPAPTLAREARQLAHRDTRAQPVLTRPAEAPLADAPVVVQAPASLPVAVAEPATTPAVAQPVPAAPVSRPTTVDPVALAAYGRDIAEAVAAHQRYPRLAQIRQWQGATLLQLKLATDGQLQSVRVLSSSGHEALDRQAIDMVRAASPLPPLPPSLAGRSLTIEIPVVFKLPP